MAKRCRNGFWNERDACCGFRRTLRAPRSVRSRLATARRTRCFHWTPGMVGARRLGVRSIGRFSDQTSLRRAILHRGNGRCALGRGIAARRRRRGALGHRRLSPGWVLRSERFDPASEAGASNGAESRRECRGWSHACGSHERLCLRGARPLIVDAGTYTYRRKTADLVMRHGNGVITSGARWLITLSP